MNEQNDSENDVVRLPLWKNALDEMRKEGITHGKTWEAEFFERQLRCNRDEMKYGLGISEIRRELEKDGYYLSGRGQKGNQFVILPPQSNADIMAGYQRAALDALKRGVVLGTNTRLDSLSDSDRKRHEGLLERMAMRAVLMQRTSRVISVLKSKAPEVLEDKP